MKSASYSIEVISSIVLVRKTGLWDMVSDIAYVTELSEVFSRFKSKSFIVLVDMRNWVCSPDLLLSNLKTNVRLDRRAQTAECWLVDDPQQSDHLLRYVDIPSINFLRTQKLDDVNLWLSQQPISEQQRLTLLAWLNNCE